MFSSKQINNVNSDVTGDNVGPQHLEMRVKAYMLS